MFHKNCKLLIAFSAAILSLVAAYANAAPVTQQRAQEIAREFLLKEQTSPPQIVSKTTEELMMPSQAASLTFGSVYSIEDENDQLLAYVQELQPQGFIIVAADDGMKQVLGFSFEGYFDVDSVSGNPLLGFVVADTKARMRMISEYGSDMTPPKSSVSLSNTQWGPYIHTHWKQTGHYDDKCPLDPKSTSSRSLVGCVAISLGQIVNYWQFPKQISFSDAGDRYQSRGENGRFWIPDTWSTQDYPNFSTLNGALSNISYSEDDNEEANLLFGLGVKIRTSYSKSGSSAGHYRTTSALSDGLGYGSARYMNIVRFQDGDIVENRWDEARSILITNLKSGFPAILGVRDVNVLPFNLFSGGNHSIIADGFRDGDDYFHLNIGWGSLQSPLWYDLPDFTVILPWPADYDIVDDMIYDICPFKGWNQIGADQRNSYYAIYPAPTSAPERKWHVNIPGGLPIPYSYSHLVIGTGGRIYASLGPSSMGDSYHPYIVIYDKFGTRENLIEVTHSNVDISYLCQNSRGEIFFPSGTAGPTAWDLKIFRLNPKTDEITPIFTHSSPDDGISEMIKVDGDNYLYFVVQPRYTANYAKFYCISRTGTNKWTPYSFPSSAEFHRTMPAIDEDRDRIYLNYFEKTEQYKGRSHLITFKRSDGTVVFDEVLPNVPTHYASAMAGPPSISENGTVYIGAFTSLYAYSSNGTKLWEKSFYPAYTYRTPAIGSDGTLYVNYGKMVGGNWRPGYVRALNPANGDTKWELSLSLGESDHMGEIYASANGMVIFSYDKEGQDRLGGVKDDGATYGSMWNVVGGGTLAFGPGRTIFSIPPGQENSIYALTDQGERGDPEGMGMDFLDNGQPLGPLPVSPEDGADGLDTVSVQLSWTCSDPDGHSLKYDIYVCALVEGEEAAFVPVGSQVTGNSYTLTDLQRETQYLWSIVATDGQAFGEGPVWSFSTKSPTAVEDDEGIAILPTKYQLDQNYPNPFNPSTVIEFDLPRRSAVSIVIYNLLGQEIIKLVDHEIPAGSHQVTWDGVSSDGNRVSTGIYFYRLRTEEYIETKKMLLLK